MRIIQPHLIFYFLLSLSLIQFALADDSIHNSLYGDFLKKYVKNGVVDYKDLKKEEAKLNQYLRQLNEMTIAFINDSDRYKIKPYTLYVSSIFRWFPEDFDNDITGFFPEIRRGGPENGPGSEKG